MITNMFEGLIYWYLPMCMVVTNDCFAYIFGFFFGRTPLIKLSPKKTWEGFIGGGLATIVIGLTMTRIMSESSVMLCPKRGFDLDFRPPSNLFQMSPVCEEASSPVYVDGSLINLFVVVKSNRGVESSVRRRLSGKPICCCKV